MKLTNEQIKSVTFGAARFEEGEAGIRPLRFTEAETEYYKNFSEDFYKKSFSSAGIRLEFTTDSRRLAFHAKVTPGSSRLYCHFDLYVGGIYQGQVGTDSTDTTVAAEWDLGKGEKEVKLYLPWSATTTLSSVTLDDGASLTPAEKTRTMLIYGDSITQGYDTLHPSLSYASLLADALDAEAYDKGIGGERFRPALAEVTPEGDFDIITVAYGTNDWSGATLEDFENNCRGFYETLAKKHPNAKIFALTPIWRADHTTRTTSVGDFFHVKEFIEEVTSPFSNVTVIDGYGFLPKDPALFSDAYLHPNDEGFILYFRALYEQVKKYL